MHTRYRLKSRLTRVTTYRMDRTVMVMGQNSSHVFHLAEYLIKTIPRDPFLSFCSHDFVSHDSAIRFTHAFSLQSPLSLLRSIAISRLLAVIRLVAMASSANRVWCTTCNAFRSSEDFLSFKSGKPRKTCSGHQKKRDLDASLDSWDALLTELREWNHPVC